MPAKGGMAAAATSVEVLAGALMALLAAPAAAQGAPPQLTDAQLARANAAELAGAWRPPPGEPLAHYAAGYAKQMCSGVFISGMTPAFVDVTLGDGNALAPVIQRTRLGEPVVDRASAEVRVTTDSGLTRVARDVGDQGCVVLPMGDDRLRFAPTTRQRMPGAAPRAAGQPPAARVPLQLDGGPLAAAVEAAFTPEDALTQAFVVSWRGQVVAERYGPQADAGTPLEGWSMGKSLIATLLGRILNDGTYTLDEPAPIPEWQGAGDPRQGIRIRDILQMSSGLRLRAEQDPDYLPDGRYPDHWYYYTAANAFSYAATRPPQWPPGIVGRYRNTDPLLASYLVRLAVEKRGEDYLSFPQRALFEPLGIRSAVLETDATGNFVTQGSELMTARDWARLGELYLQDGVWAGRRLLPEGFVKFVTTPAPAWEADGRPMYGGFFWLNRLKALPVPESAYYMLGAGGQHVIIIPSHDLVVVRLGRSAGVRAGTAALHRALTVLVKAVPAR